VRTMTKNNLNAIRYIRLFVGRNYSKALEADHPRMIELMTDLKGLRMWDLDIGCARGTPKWKAWKIVAVALLETRSSVQRVTMLGSIDWKRKAELGNGNSKFLRQATMLTLDESDGKIIGVHTYV